MRLLWTLILFVDLFSFNLNFYFCLSLYGSYQYKEFTGGFMFVHVWVALLQNKNYLRQHWKHLWYTHTHTTTHRQLHTPGWGNSTVTLQWRGWHHSVWEGNPGSGVSENSGKKRSLTSKSSRLLRDLRLLSEHDEQRKQEGAAHLLGDQSQPGHMARVRSELQILSTCMNNMKCL